MTLPRVTNTGKKMKVMKVTGRLRTADKVKQSSRLSRSAELLQHLPEMAGRALNFFSFVDELSCNGEYPLHSLHIST